MVNNNIISNNLKTLVFQNCFFRTYILGCLCEDVNGRQKTGPTGEICPVCEEEFKYLVLEEDTRTAWDIHMEIQLSKVKSIYIY